MPPAFFVDISKCFDTIDHDFLIQKCKYYDVYGNEIKWFMNDMTNRSHVVHCHGDTSKRLYVKTGVPQGSVPGPLMFLLYINNISQSIVKTLINMFADDTSLYTMGTNFKQVNDNLLNNVTNVHDWYTNNKLAVNVPKRKVMLVTNKNAPKMIRN